MTGAGDIRCLGCSTGGIMPHRESCPEAGDREAALYGDVVVAPLPQIMRPTFVYTEGDEVPQEYLDAAERGELGIEYRPRPVVTLPEFLLARLDEEEERVRSYVWMGQTQSGLDRSLREIGARRAVVQRCGTSEGDPERWLDGYYAGILGDWVLRVLAEPYDAHGDYDEGWRP